MQETDAERRMQILRGTYIEPPPTESEKEHGPKEGRPDASARAWKRGRITGENDTDREMRFVQEDRAMLPAKAEMQMISKKSSEAPLMDGQGHINLFPNNGRSNKEIKNAEAEEGKAKKKKEYEDQYTMRFSNAAGFKQAIDQTPWYEKTGVDDTTKESVDVLSKDTWGNDDPRRKEREKMRMAADDPLALMRNGAARVREVEKEKINWKKEKEREIQELEEEERRRANKRRRQPREEDRSDSHRSHRDGGRETVFRHSHRHHGHSCSGDRRRKPGRSYDGTADEPTTSRKEASTGGKL